MEKIRCIICNSYNDSPFITLDDNKLSITHTFELVECNECKLIYLNPRFNNEQIKSFYGNDYIPHKKTFLTFKDQLYNICQKITFKWKKKIISKYKKFPGYLLDVGSGNNKFADYMTFNKWKTTTYDTFIYDSNNITKLDDISNNFFDIVTLWHSLEHIHDVELLFNNIIRILKKDGFILIACPNINAIERKIIKNKWIAYDVPRHLYHFSSKSLKKLLEKYNIEIIDIYRMPQDTVFNITMSFKNRYLYKIVLIIYSLLLSLIFKRRSSSLLYMCKLN